MAGEVSPQSYKDVVVFLATAGVVVPLFHRLRISPVLGFLLAGVALGPDGLGRLAPEHPWISAFTITDAEEVKVLAELGVVFLLFMIGLELSWERLKAMRRLVFGFGMAQVVTCAAAIGIVGYALGLSPAGAAVAGMALALSSTALVVPLLSERKRLHGPAGRSSFAVLLAQDLAVAPILVAVGVLASAAAAGADQPWLQGVVSLGPAALALAGIVLFGRLLLRPLFKSVARSNSRELFVAACLLVVIGTGLAAAVSGLSMALGAFVAGLLLAETEWRREVEVTIEPFKGLLLGLFFVSMGIGLDLDAVAASPLGVFGAALLVAAIKIALTFSLARVFGVPTKPALEAALLLGPAGEFSIVVLNVALDGGLLPPVVGQGLLVSATVSLFLVPLFAWAGRRALHGDRRIAGESPEEPEAIVGAAPEAGPVLIVGYGRVGELVGDLLAEHAVPYVAVDSDPKLVTKLRDQGRTVWYGDAARPEFLHRCGLDEARALVVTMDARDKVSEVVRTARALRPDLVVIARARDARHAAELYALGATDAVPETTEASLQLAENTLVDVGVPMGLVLATIHEKRDEYRRLFQEKAGGGRVTRALRAIRADGTNG